MTATVRDALVAYESAFYEGLRVEFGARFRALERDGVTSDHLPDPAELAARIVGSAPLAPSPLVELTGPFYDTAGLTSWLGVSRQALDGRARHLSILQLSTGEGQRVYPAWQFTAQGTVLPQLAQVLRVLATGTPDRWTWALWLTAPADETDGASAVSWLAAHRDPAPVLAAARADAARWAA